MPKKDSIEVYKQIAKSLGGECLSDIYINGRTKLLWKCQNEHTWEAIPESIKRGHWCPICAGRAKYTIEEIQSYAKSKGGKCLSDIYVNNKTKLVWECSEGHVWSATFHDVKGDNTWCPHCYKFYSEEKCRYIFESLFLKPFKKNRKVLGKGYELDGYNQELNIAFEYNGIQHYQFDTFFYKSKRAFEKRIRDDQEKERLCKEKRIHLVVIPYTVNVGDERLLTYIFDQLHDLNILPKIKFTELNLEDFYKASSVLRELRGLAKSKGGQLLSNEYVNDKTKLRWKCSEGHMWEAVPNNIKNGSWCPHCSGVMRLSIEDMHTLAKEHRGKCLSTEYLNNKTPLEWQCEKGHRWKARPDSVRNGKWCLICSGKQPLTIELMREIAGQHGGKCISTEYVNDDTKLKWQCAEGHVWEARSQNIRKGQWCRVCSGALKLTIEEMRSIAESKGGKCLSSEYKDNKTKLKWQCSEGHIWEATPNPIKSKGNWCPTCAIKNHKKPKRKLTIDDMRLLAMSRQGKCLSDVYTNGATKLFWKCKEGHVWEATPESVKNAGSWCPTCARSKKIRI